MVSQLPDIDALRELYNVNPVASAFFDHAAGRERDQSETKVDRTLVILKAAGHDFARRDIIAFFKRIEDLGCGRFIEGRRGWPSRFVWNAAMIGVARAATGENHTITPVPSDTAENANGLDTQLEEQDGLQSFSEDSEADEELGEIGGIGLEEEDTTSSFEITEPFDPAKIRVDTRPMVISLLMDRIKNKEIDLAPGFQRKGGIWTARAKSRLIESLLIRIPLPALYMDGSDESKWLVVDGLQRLSALKGFILDRTLRLTGMEFLGKECNGKTFDQLPRNLQRRIQETQVTVFLIQENTPPEVKFNIFKRINTGGLPLSSQEIRHALNQGKACALLQRLAESAEFKTATNNGIRDDRMGDRECILRLLAFMRTPYIDYKANNLDAFLNQCMAELNTIADGAIERLEQRFRQAMIECYKLFGDRAFRKEKPGSPRRFPINRALFEVWAANIEALPTESVEQLYERRADLRRRFVQLLEEDSTFDAAISFGTGDPQKVRARFSRINDIIQETLQ